MADRFQLFRLSLLPHGQLDAFDPFPAETKEDHLRRVFSGPHQFDHYGNQFHYLPDLERSRPNAILGRLGRPVTVQENLPPESQLIEISHDAWKACVLLIDPTDHGDGQKVSFEINSRVGRASSLLAALVNAINLQNAHSSYTIEAQALVDAEPFWQFAERNRGNVTSLTFEFVVPNGLWSADTNHCANRHVAPSRSPSFTTQPRSLTR